MPGVIQPRNMNSGFEIDCRCPSRPRTLATGRKSNGAQVRTARKALSAATWKNGLVLRFEHPRIGRGAKPSCSRKGYQTLHVEVLGVPERRRAGSSSRAGARAGRRSRSARACAAQAGAGAEGRQVGLSVVAGCGAPLTFALVEQRPDAGFLSIFSASLRIELARLRRLLFFFAPLPLPVLGLVLLQRFGDRVGLGLRPTSSPPPPWARLGLGLGLRLWLRQLRLALLTRRTRRDRRSKTISGFSTTLSAGFSHWFRLGDLLDQLLQAGRSSSTC